MIGPNFKTHFFLSDFESNRIRIVATQTYMKISPGKNKVKKLHTIKAKKHDILLEGSCFLARCHTFWPL